MDKWSMSYDHYCKHVLVFYLLRRLLRWMVHNGKIKKLPFIVWYHYIKSIQQKIDNRHTAENSIMSTVCILMCVSSTHFFVGKRDKHYREKRNKTNGALKLIDMVGIGGGSPSTIWMECFMVCTWIIHPINIMNE